MSTKELEIDPMNMQEPVTLMKFQNPVIWVMLGDPL